MVELLLKRYLWLIDTLKRGGEMAFDEISAKWDKSARTRTKFVLHNKSGGYRRELLDKVGY